MTPDKDGSQILTDGNRSGAAEANSAEAGAKVTGGGGPPKDAPLAADPWGFDEPFAVFDAWMRDAEAAEVNDPNAMALATVDEAGLPDVRIVLLKGVDARGFVFYSNRESAKGSELASHDRAGPAKAGLVLHWKSLRRQVRIRGIVETVTDREADDYYATRPRGSRIGAWASQQSRPLESRAALEGAVAEATARFGEGEIPRPAYWIGWRVLPLQVEFWQDKPFRLHDRVVFSRSGVEEGVWTRGRLFP